MSVIGFAADEIKSMEAAALDICGDHVAGDLWPAFYVSNQNAYLELYEGRSLTDEQKAAHRAEYARTQPCAQYTPKTPGELMERLQSLIYNTDEFQGEQEQQRRRLLDCVGFEMMPTDGGPAVHLDFCANVQRVDFDHYRITSINPHGPKEPYTFACLDFKPHPFEGLTTTDPREAFRYVWEMHEDCKADYRAQESRLMLEFMALLDSGKSYQAAQMEMLKRQPSAS